MTTETKAKHTPTPWRVYPEYTRSNLYSLWDANDNYPADTSPSAMDANAGFIVRAVNAHDALLEACKKALTCGLDSNVRSLVLEALQKARG